MQCVAEIKFQPMQKITLDNIITVISTAGEIEQSGSTAVADHTCYMDTNDYKLAAAKMSLSIVSGNKTNTMVFTKRDLTKGCWVAGQKTYFIVPTGESIDIKKVPEYFTVWPEKTIVASSLQEVMRSSVNGQQVNIKLPDDTNLMISIENAKLAGNGRNVSSQMVRLQLIAGNFLSMIRVAQLLAEKILLSLIIDDDYVEGLRLLGISVKPDQAGIFLHHTAEENVHSVFINSLCGLWQGIVVCAGDFMHQPDNPKYVHQLRVKLRQFRSVLSFGKPLLNRQAYDDLQEKMRQAGRTLAGLRSLDVLISIWNKIDRQLPDSRHSNELLNLLTKERKKEQQRVLALPVHKVLTMVALDSWAFILDWPQNINRQNEISWHKYTQKRAKSWLKDLRAMNKEVSLDNAAQVHRMRIKIKKLRYVLEFVLPAFHDYDQNFIALLKELQDNLGEIHDCADTIYFINSLQVPGGNDKLAHQTGQLIGWKLYSSDLARKLVTASWDGLKQYSSHL